MGLSGGPDSITLLHLLKQAGIGVVAAHLDHMLRDSSSVEAQQVAGICEQWSVEFVSEQIDVGKYAADQHLSLEEAARQCRYLFLFDHASKIGAQSVITGHNADDQVETLLMHLLRGSGMRGLSGMKTVETELPWQAGIPLWRPMLGVEREAILAYCEANQLNPIYDESNQDVRFFRNRLRHELLPLLVQINPQIKHILQRNADVIGTDDALLEQITDEIWSACVKEVAANWTIIDRDLFNAQPLSLRRRMLRKAILHHRPGLRDVGFEAVERCLQQVGETPNGLKRYDLSSGLDFFISEATITLIEHGTSLPVKDLPQLAEMRNYQLKVDEQLVLANGWVLHAMRLSKDNFSEINPSLLTHPNHAWLSADKFAFPLFVRGREAGDSWNPLGLNGHSQKMSDFFINEKVPLEARKRWPLVTNGGEIIWVAGFRPAEGYQLDTSESSIVHLWMDRSIH